MKPLDPRLLRHAAAARTHLAVSVAVGVATAGLVLAQAEVLSVTVADVTAGRPFRALGAASLVLSSVVVGRAALAWAAEAIGQRAAATVTSQVRHRLVAAHAAAVAGGAAPDRAATGALAGRGLDALQPYVARYLPQLALAAIVPPVVIVRLALADLTAAVIVVLTLPLVPLFMVLIGRATEAASARRWRALSRLSHHLLDVVTGMPTLRAFGRGAAQQDAVRRSTDRYRTTTMATLRVAFLSSLVLEVLATLSVALVAVSVGLRLVSGGLDLRTGLLAIVLAPEAYLPLRLLGANHHASAEGLAAADAAFAVIEAPAGPPDEARVEAGFAGAVDAVEVIDVVVTHDGRDVDAPAGASFTVRRGETVAVIGPSGSGKTTLARVLLGLRRPTAGRVVVHAGGRPYELGDLDPARWHERVAWVPQHPYVAPGTVADNVRLGRPTLADATVAAALAAVGLAGEADRTVGEAGVGLSSGERRRVALARALVRDAEVLVLDEPTAGLDADAEAAVLDAVRTLAPTAAVLVLTHRPAVVGAADRVVTVRSAATRASVAA